MDASKNILAFFEYSETWKPTLVGKRCRVRTPSPRAGLTPDFWIRTVNGRIIGEIVGYPIPVSSWVRRYSYEIYDIKNRLLGIVWEKASGFGSEWVLENVERNILATIEGSRKAKNYRVMNRNNEVVARCYRSPGIGEGFYRVEILESDLDAFLVLNYVIVLDRVRRYVMRGGN